MKEEKGIEVTITLQSKDVTLIRYALGRIKCTSERQAREEKDIAKKYMANENAKYLADLEQKLYDAQIAEVVRIRKERGLN